VARIRLVAALEILVCSGLPTQLAIAALLSLAGIGPYDARGHMNASYVFAVSLLDAVVIVGLAVWFLRSHGERFSDVMFGQRPDRVEMAHGLVHIPVVFLIAVGFMTAIQQVVPWMHNVETNPFQGLIQNRGDAAMFAVIAIVGGGVREEVQRAFILSRFERHLGGGWVGIVVSSVGFGLGHIIQGRDVAVTTAALGAFWGLVYLKRRSIVAPVVSHSGFNAAEIIRYTFYGA
jgi:membrane protease YdiL (CAAX protease family)